MAVKVVARELTPEGHAALTGPARARTAPARLVDRARLLPAAAQGQSAGRIAAGPGGPRPTA